MVIVGSSWMIKENARPFSLGDVDESIFNERIYLVFLVVGAWEKYLIYKAEKEAHIFMMKSFAFTIALALMMNPDSVPYALSITTGFTAALAGGWLICIAVFVHREYGTDMFGPIYGSFLTAGAAGFYAFNEVLYAQVFESYATKDVYGVK